jgi:hypothetical protein
MVFISSQKVHVSKAWSPRVVLLDVMGSLKAKA